VEGGVKNMPHEPKKKHSKERKRTRRAAITLKATNLMVCTNCSSKTLAHMICRNCGFYDGKIVKAKAVVTRA